MMTHTIECIYAKDRNKKENWKTSLLQNERLLLFIISTVPSTVTATQPSGRFTLDYKI